MANNMHRFCLKLLGLPVPIYNLTRMTVSNVQSLGDVNLLIVMDPSNAENKEARALKTDGLIPYLYNAVDENENIATPYYDDEERTVASKYTKNPKVSEAVIPYLHGELIQYGEISILNLTTGSINFNDSSPLPGQPGRNALCVNFGDSVSNLPEISINKSNLTSLSYSSNSESGVGNLFYVHKFGNYIAVMEEFLLENINLGENGSDKRIYYWDGDPNDLAAPPRGIYGSVGGSSFTLLGQISKNQDGTITYNTETYAKWSGNTYIQQVYLEDDANSGAIEHPYYVLKRYTKSGKGLFLTEDVLYYQPGDVNIGTTLYRASRGRIIEEATDITINTIGNNAQSRFIYIDTNKGIYQLAVVGYQDIKDNESYTSTPAYVGTANTKTGINIKKENDKVYIWLADNENRQVCPKVEITSTIGSNITTLNVINRTIQYSTQGGD